MLWRSVRGQGVAGSRAVRAVRQHLVEMRLDQVEQVGNDLRIKGLVQPGGTTEVPGMDHQVNEAEPQERNCWDVTLRTCNELLGRRGGERVSLLSR